MEKPINWNHKINLIGKKVEDPRLHLCEKCNFPILIYGRMIPCKHVFCFDCAKTIEKVCHRCGDNVTRIEQSLQGHIFMCDIGYPKHSHQGCRRTYLSQRDLQAHIDHRHKKTSKVQSSSGKERRLSDPRGETRGERAERRTTDVSRVDPRTDPNRPDPRLGARTTTYQQVQNYALESTVQVQAPSGDYGMAQAPPTGVPPPPTVMVPPPSGMVPPTSAMVSPSSVMVQPTGGMVQHQPPESDQSDYHVPVRNTNLITVPIQDSGADYQAPPAQYAASNPPPPAVPGPPPIQGPVPVQYPGPVPVDHQPQMAAYPVVHAGPVMTPQPGGAPGYPPTVRPMPPQPGPYISGPQAAPRYDQPPHPPSSSYGPPPPVSSTYSAPVSGAWTQPTQSHAGPAPDGLAPKPAHGPIPDSTTYTPGSYY